jgi:hypothetical protein
LTSALVATKTWCGSRLLNSTRFGGVTGNRCHRSPTCHEAHQLMF